MGFCSVCHSETAGSFCAECGTQLNTAIAHSAPGGRNVALLGCALAGVGVFLPMIRVPIVGELTYFLNGHGDGVIILIIAIVSALAAYRYAAVPTLGGTVTLGFLAFYYAHVQSVLDGAEKNLQRNGGLFSGLGEMFMQSIHFEYGFYAMAIGGALMLVSAFVPRPRTAMVANPDANKDFPKIEGS